MHLGPGQKNYLPGWINVDANAFTAQCDIWADLRNPLLFGDSTIDAIYSHHVVEHQPDLASHFKDAYRCLKPCGVYRVGGPNGDEAIHNFVLGNTAWSNDFPEPRKSIGGRFENFIFCKGEHLTMPTFSYLLELMEEAGFANINKCRPTIETNYGNFFPECLLKESESDFNRRHTLIVEA
jgi:predicted SAM-dependent methyltransferase